MALSNDRGTNMLYSPVIWVADTGASCHVTNSDEGAIPSINTDPQALVSYQLNASGKKMRTTKIIDIKGTIRGKVNSSINIRLNDCRFGGSKFNLCSITKLTDSGWIMTGDKTGIYLRKGNTVLQFDIPVTTSQGRLWAARIDRRSPNSEGDELTLATPTTMNLRKAHDFCGHNSLDQTQKTAAHLGWTITRTPFHRCESCAIGKAKQRDLGQGKQNPPTLVGELWYIDGMRLKKPNTGRAIFPTNHCLDMAVEHITGAIFAGWYGTKSAFISPFCTKFHNLQATHGKEIRRIRCDDAGENRKIINGQNWRQDIQFEFKAKTPQRNSRVETKIYHICNKTRATLDAAHIPDHYRYVLFTHFSKYCCQTEMLTVVDVDGVSKTRHEHLYGRLPRWVEHMQVAGTAGIVKTHTRTTLKVDARGKKCLFVCYSTDHANDCYVMYDPRTRAIIHSRDVLWLDGMYFSPKTTPGVPITIQGIQSPADEGSVSSETVYDSEISSTDDSSTNSSSGNSTCVNSDMPFDDDEEASEAESEADDEASMPEPECEATERYRTRSGRTVRPPRAHDGQEIAALALTIEDDYMDDICLIGVDEVEQIAPQGTDEVRQTAPPFQDDAMAEEEYKGRTAVHSR